MTETSQSLNMMATTVINQTLYIKAPTIESDTGFPIKSFRFREQTAIRVYDGIRWTGNKHEEWNPAYANEPADTSTCICRNLEETGLSAIQSLEVLRIYYPESIE